MAEAIRSKIVVGLSETEATALAELFDAQENLPKALEDLNNTIQAI